MTSLNGLSIPFLGYGIGLRRAHYDEFLLRSAPMPDWIEIISENYMSYGGKPKAMLNFFLDKKIPIVAHGVGLSVGSGDDLNEDYCFKLNNLLEKINAPWFSDHLCFSSTLNHQFHDLIPILRNAETLKQLIHKIQTIQKKIKIPFAIENISYYAESSHHTMSEVDFLNEILKQTNTYLLLDINNVYVNSKNLNFSAEKYIDQLDTTKVIQIHLAGHFDQGKRLIDTHGALVTDEVWQLYHYFLRKEKREISTLIEWDNNLPSLDELMNECLKAKNLAELAIKDHL
jgi:uncharacterized protein